MKTKSIIFLALMMILSLASCRKSLFINGNKNISTQTRELEPFSKLANNGSFEVTIIKDTLSFVIIEAESNLIPHILCTIDNDALIIDSQETLNSHRSMKLEVHTPSLQAMELKGSGKIDFETFTADHFSAVVDGSGNINGSVICDDAYLAIKGSGNLSLGLATESLLASIEGSGDLRIAGESLDSKLEIYGSGDISDYDFVHYDCEVISDGSGSIYTSVINSLKIIIEGSGSVHYKGNPFLQSVINGSGSVVKH